jgi:hypothetical protein
LFLLVAVAAVAQPTITSLSGTTSARSSRVLRWHYTDSGTFYWNTLSPLNDPILLSGGLDWPNPGFFEAVSTTGKSLWKTLLPTENGLQIFPYGRSRFSNDGETAYSGSLLYGQLQHTDYSYLYSVQTAETVVLRPAVLDAESGSASLPLPFFLLIFSWREATQERRGRLVKATFFAPRSGRSEAQRLDWPPALRTLSSEKMGDHPSPWSPIFFCCAFFLSLCYRSGAYSAT